MIKNVLNGHKHKKMYVKNVHKIQHYLIKLMNVNKLQILLKIVKYMKMNIHVKNVLMVII